MCSFIRTTFARNSFFFFCSQFQSDVVLDGCRPFNVNVPGPVRGRRDRLAGLQTRPGLTGAVHRTPSRRATNVVSADDQQLRDDQHDDVRHRPAVVVRRRPPVDSRAQPVRQTVLNRRPLRFRSRSVPFGRRR